MWWDNDKDSDAAQRFKNLLFLEIWLPNKERDQIIPILGGIILVALFLFGAYKLIEGFWSWLF